MSKSIRTIEYMLCRIPFNEEQESALKDALDALKKSNEPMLPTSTIDDWYSYESE